MSNKGPDRDSETDSGPTSPAARPTPVRSLMGQDAAPREEPSEPPPRTFTADGVSWLAEALGASRTGTGADSGAPLLHIVFSREGSRVGRERAVLAVGGSLDDLGDDALCDLLRRARPIPGV